MPSTLGLTLLHILSLCGTHLRVWKCPQPWALPYYTYYLCVGPIRGFGNALDLGPYPYYMYYLCIGPIRGFGNALDLGPYPTTCTILGWDWKCPRPWGLTLLQVLSLCRTHYRVWKCRLRHCALPYYYMVLSLCKAQ